MSQPGTFERVYAALKERLRSGVLRPGERLEPAALSDELNASVTPVRDALHRLTGERLVDAPRHEGFRAPLLSEAMLRHLYAWHRDILLLSIGRRRAAQVVWPSKEKRPTDDRLSAVFALLAESSGNPEHLAALKNVTERLEPYERFEHEFLDATQDESENIVSAIDNGDLKRLRASLLRYHRRRQRIVPVLLARLQRVS